MMDVYGLDQHTYFYASFMLLFAYPIKRNVRRGNVTGQNGRSIKKYLVREKMWVTHT